jgi:8-amino-7-oxononanoate synthase
MDNWVDYIAKRHQALPVLRTRLSKVSGTARHLTTHTEKYLNFISNDYLGLSSDTAIIEALYNACKIYGVGSTGAPSLSGYSEEHHLLAQEIAYWLQYEKCLLFNSGYQLNIGIFSQLIDSNTRVWLDKKCHASHIDGILLSRAKFSTFNQTNIDQVIERIKQEPNCCHLILSEGTFSMDGSCNYWGKLIKLKLFNPDNVLLVIDDAHGIGALGLNGYGTLEQLGLKRQNIDLVIGTFGKAFGTHGGFICGSSQIIDYLQQSVRSQIFSTNLPPAIARATRESLAIISSDRGVILRERLANNITYFNELAKQAGLNLGNDIFLNQSAIQLLIYTDYERVAHIYNQLHKENILVGKITYPTVAKDKPRLRISLNAEHEKVDIEKLVSCLANIE